MASPPIDRLRDLCAGGGERLDLLEAALALSAAQRGTAVDAEPYRQHVAAMADTVGDLVRRRGAAPGLLGEVIARAYAYRGDSETYDDLQNADIVRVIERRKGLPVALAILYLHVARAQAWAATGLAFPGHFLIRVEIEGARHVVDPFNEGMVRDAADLRELLRKVLGPEAEASPVHFDPVPDRQVLLRLENNIRMRLVQREDWPGAMRSLERMLVIAPDQPPLFYEAGQINVRLDKRRAAIDAFARFLDMDGGRGDPQMREHASALLRELRRGLN